MHECMNECTNENDRPSFFFSFSLFASRSLSSLSFRSPSRYGAFTATSAPLAQNEALVCPTCRDESTYQRQLRQVRQGLGHTQLPLPAPSSSRRTAAAAVGTSPKTSRRLSPATVTSSSSSSRRSQPHGASSASRGTGDTRLRSQKMAPRPPPRRHSCSSSHGCITADVSRYSRPTSATGGAEKQAQKEAATCPLERR